jgi:hypothetical protein
MDTLEALAGAGFKADVVLVMHNGSGTVTTDYAKGRGRERSTLGRRPA